MGWSPSWEGVLNLTRCGVFWGNIICFPQKQSCSAPVLPSKELTPVGLCPGGFLVGRSVGTGFPIHSLCAFPSGGDKTPTKASHCNDTVPQISVWHVQIQPLSR